MSDIDKLNAMAAMDSASKEAAVELQAIIDKNGSIKEVVSWWKKWFGKAGHKRLGRLLVEEGKKS